MAPVLGYFLPLGAAHIPMLMRENLTYLHSNLFAYKHKTTFAQQWAHTHTHTHTTHICVSVGHMLNGEMKRKRPMGKAVT